jgi:hypothetical protein
MFYCHRCQHEVDSDWVPCTEDSGGDFWLMCDEHEIKCSRCDQTLTKEDEEAGLITTWGDAVCKGCWNKCVA